MTHYLITGGTGFIGASLAVAMVRAGHNVKILDNQSRGTLRRLSAIEGEYEFIQGDVRNAEVVNQAVKGVDCVCHLASINGTEYFYSMPETVLDVGVKGMVNVIDACIKYHIPQLALASSSEVYHIPEQIPTKEDVPLSIPNVFNPRYSYAAAKIISEIMTVNYGRKFFERVLIFRPHNVYGPDMGCEHVIPQFVLRMQNLISKTAKTLQFPIQGTGKETRAFIYIDDFVNGLMLLLERGKNQEIYNIGSEIEVTIEYLVQLLAKFFGREVEITSTVSPEGGTPRRCPNTEKIKQLGFSADTSIEQGIIFTARWYIDNLHLFETQNESLTVRGK